MRKRSSNIIDSRDAATTMMMMATAIAPVFVYLVNDVVFEDCVEDLFELRDDHYLLTSVEQLASLTATAAEEGSIRKN